MKDVLDRFEEVAENPQTCAFEWKKETGRPVVGTFCSYAPEEIIYAAGALPYRMLGTGGAKGYSDAYLQSYCCSVVKNTLDDLLSGELDFLDGAVFPHTCDSVQRLSDIFRLNMKNSFHLDAVLPAKLDTPSAAHYMKSVLERLAGDLEERLDTRVTKQDLTDAVLVFNRIRNGLRTLADAGMDNRINITAGELHTISRGVTAMDPAEAADLLDRLCTFIQPKAEPGSGPSKRIGLTGSVCGVPSVYETIEQAGGRVVLDDFCTTERYTDFAVDESADPLPAIAARYLKKADCPCKHSSLYSRGERIVEKAEKRGVKGVIFLLLKFCDPHAFDYPYIRDMLELKGIKSMVFELDDEQSVHAQFRTRCEAFMEML
ncbi:MAG: 2-hydroxyacyl-CoA dehydratase family protein [Desulfarculaceae bacterium]|nr:2-hydroxyacyl-CoA dehydratase family protein [Desulfarculaceae bacterium]